jgi:hypothetical protein
MNKTEYFLQQHLKVQPMFVGIREMQSALCKTSARHPNTNQCCVINVRLLKCCSVIESMPLFWDCLLHIPSMIHLAVVPVSNDLQFHFITTRYGHLKPLTKTKHGLAPIITAATIQIKKQGVNTPPSNRSRII